MTDKYATRRRRLRKLADTHTVAEIAVKLSMTASSVRDTLRRMRIHAQPAQRAKPKQTHDWPTIIRDGAQSEGIPEAAYMARMASRVTLRVATQLMGLACDRTSLEVLQTYLTAQGYESPPIGSENDGAGEWLNPVIFYELQINIQRRREAEEDADETV